jgi:hypothetical protein
MIMSVADIRELIRQGESERVEFKTSLRDVSTLVNIVSALANTHGGVIIVGIREPDIIVGTQPEQVFMIVERAKGMLMPAIDLNVSTIEIDYKQVVVISVPESKDVIFGNGMALKRVGEQTRPLSPQDLELKIPAPADTDEIRKLADAISKQTEIIESLRNDLREENSYKNKLKGYLIGGVIGAVLGAIAASLIG